MRKRITGNGGIFMKYFKIEIIENFRQEKGWSVTRFCKECKIGLDVYKKIINQQINFRANMLFRIARVIGLQVYQLVY